LILVKSITNRGKDKVKLNSCDGIGIKIISMKLGIISGCLKCHIQSIKKSLEIAAKKDNERRIMENLFI